MSPVRQQAVVVHNRLVQSGVVTVYDRATLGQDGVEQRADVPGLDTREGGG
jgi:hypothetical protein